MKHIKDKVFNEYKRFLKNNGVFCRAMQIHKQRMDKMGAERFLYWFNKDPLRIMSNADMFTSWAESKERKLFWWKISNRWKIKCLKEKIGYYKYNKYDYSTVVKMLMRFEQKYRLDISGEELKFVVLNIKELNELKDKLI